MRTTYEWCWRQVDEHGDVIELYHSDKLREQPFDGLGELELIRDVGDEFEGLVDRQYADFADSISTHFDGGAKVPQRFIKEWNRFTKA